jgi:hypothetical protein
MHYQHIHAYIMSMRNASVSWDFLFFRIHTISSLKTGSSWHPLEDLVSCLQTVRSHFNTNDPDTLECSHVCMLPETARANALL